MPLWSLTKVEPPEQIKALRFSVLIISTEMPTQKTVACKHDYSPVQYTPKTTTLDPKNFQDFAAPPL